MVLKFRTIKEWYLRYERSISLAALVGGFFFDFITLQRVDQLFENLWVGCLLLLASTGIILLNVYENRKNWFSEKNARLIHFWLILLVQFAFGGLLSSFLVFYYRSATIVASWPFLLLLFIVFISNEMLKQHYTRLIFQTSVLFISIFSFAIFIIPVLFHEISTRMFILSGLVSVVAIGLFIVLLWFISKERFKQSKIILFCSLLAIYVVVNVLYFTNLIPPIPLSLKDAGVYHSIQKIPGGNYLASEESQKGFDLFNRYPVFHKQSTLPVYVYTSIFSPTKFITSVIHEWQYYDEVKKTWVVANRTPLGIIGGRDGGFRTYSFKNNLRVGKWRVDVKTTRGQLIGRVTFRIEEASGPLMLHSVTL